ncbi:MAG: hypothetical protein ACXU82_16825 [Caulobacteraceae bacterium]
MTGAVLACLVALCALTLLFGRRFPVSWACFGCGLVGGFISIQQRLKTFGDGELDLLSKSWFQIVLVPIYGGLFALILYVGLLAEVVKGDLFPKFSIPAFHSPPTTADLQAFFAETYPVSGQDLAKLLFWSVVAGFSERFIPQIIGKADGGRDAAAAPADDEPSAAPPAPERPGLERLEGGVHQGAHKS